MLLGIHQDRLPGSGVFCFVHARERRAVVRPAACCSCFCDALLLCAELSQRHLISMYKLRRASRSRLDWSGRYTQPTSCLRPACPTQATRLHQLVAQAQAHCEAFTRSASGKVGRPLHCQILAAWQQHCNVQLPVERPHNNRPNRWPTRLCDGVPLTQLLCSAYIPCPRENNKTGGPPMTTAFINMDVNNASSRHVHVKCPRPSAVRRYLRVAEVQTKRAH